MGTQHSKRPLCPTPFITWRSVAQARTKFTTRTLALPQATSMPGEILRPTIHSPAIRVYVSPELPDVGVSVHGMGGTVVAHVPVLKLELSNRFS